MGNDSESEGSISNGSFFSTNEVIATESIAPGAVATEGGDDQNDDKHDNEDDKTNSTPRHTNTSRRENKQSRSRTNRSTRIRAKKNETSFNTAYPRQTDGSSIPYSPNRNSSPNRMGSTSMQRPQYYHHPYGVRPNQQFHPNAPGHVQLQQGQQQQQMYPPQQGFHPPQMMSQQGGFMGHYPTNNGPFSSQPTHSNQQINSREHRSVSSNTRGELNLSSAAIALLSSVNAATESFLGSNDEVKEADPSNNKKPNRRKKEKNNVAEEKETKLVIEIRKNSKGTILASTINIKTVNETEKSSEDEVEILPKKRRRKVKGKDDENDIRSILGPNPSLNDLEKYVSELFKKDIERKKHEVIETKEGVLSVEEKLAKAKELMPTIDHEYRVVLWDETFHQVLQYVATHKTWFLKPKSVDQSLRKWTMEQKYKYRNTFTGASRKLGGGKADQWSIEPDDESDTGDLPRRAALLTQERYERLYNVGFPFPKMVAAEGKALVSVLVLHPPFPPRE